MECVIRPDVPCDTVMSYFQVCPALSALSALTRPL